jgi:hypothetical protein
VLLIPLPPPPALNDELEQLVVASLGCEVKEDLRAVGVEVLRCKRKAASTKASAKPMNGTVASRPWRGQMVISGERSPDGRAHWWTVDFGRPRYALVSRRVKIGLAIRRSSGAKARMFVLGGRHHIVLRVAVERSYAAGRRRSLELVMTRRS